MLLQLSWLKRGAGRERFIEDVCRLPGRSMVKNPSVNTGTWVQSLL